MKLGIHSPRYSRKKRSFKKLLIVVVVWATIIAAYGLVGHP